MTDYYQLLGVSPQADQEEIKRAFRRLARETHPDANPDDAEAEARFREIAEAYEVLSDPQKRARYDRGETVEFGDLFANFGSLNDLLNQFFGGGFGIGDPFRSDPRQGQDLMVEAKISLADAAVGVEREVAFSAPQVCPECAGSGAATGTRPITCPQCNGHGAVQVARRTVLGTMSTLQTCDRCGGRGQVVDKPCPECRGGQLVTRDRTLTVKIPAGVETGSRLRLRGEGGAGPPGSRAGDLYVQVTVTPDPSFQRDGADLRHRVAIGVAEATLGTEIQVPLVDGSAMTLDVPAGTQPGTTVRVARAGLGRLNGRGRGDLIVQIDVEVPRRLSSDEEDLMRQFGELRSEATSESRSRWRRR